MSESALLKFIEKEGPISKSNVLLGFVDASLDQKENYLANLEKKEFILVDLASGERIYTFAIRDMIAYSRVNCFNECKLKYKFRYIDKIKKPWPIFLTVGSVVHGALEIYKKGKIDPNDADEMESAIEHMWRVEEENIDPKLFDSGAIDKHIDMTKEIFWNYIFLHGEDFQPYDGEVDGKIWSIERWFDKRIINPSNGEKSPWFLRGMIDMIITDKKLLDYKLLANKTKQEWANMEIQPSFYSMLMDQDEIEFVYEIMSKRTKDPSKRFQRLITKTSAERNYQAYRIIENYVHQVLRGNCRFVPERNRNCHNMCEFWEECLEW